MASFESMINVEDWISDHYLTTDETKGESFSKRVQNRVKEWKTGEDAGAMSPLTRLLEHRNDLQTALSTQDARPEDVAAVIRAAFGYGDLKPTVFDHLNETFSVHAWSGDNRSVVLVEAEKVDAVEDVLTARILGDVTNGEKTAERPAAAVVSDIFLSENPPALALIIAGQWVLLAERESWPLGRYLAVDVALAAERNDRTSKGELQRVACALARENTERSPEGVTWWIEVLEESKEHAIKVSGELRNAVRESIELIGNDVLQRRRAAGLDIESVDGNELAKQSLRYLYRILFLLFAEASPELEVLPTGTPEYDDGYGLTRLRELILNPPVSRRAQNGTHLYESLQVLFRLVDEGHDPSHGTDDVFDSEAGEPGLEFRNLRADLFQSRATSYIDEVQLSNLCLNHVLENLLLSKKSSRDRGFISYATLGVTELGQVYEGLMSYKGFIAQEDLYEVAPNGNPEKGSWVIPTSRADDVPQNSFVEVEVEAEGGGMKRIRRRHNRGSFVFRQSSRDRQRSASFYTPQVLTEFTVGQAIEVLQDEGRINKAEDVLSLSICEPAMGSGAFAVEAVRQLAELYLELRQAELGQHIPAEDRTRELQKVKAYIALHQVYGVDLNATAVELAEISLWLDTMTSELQAPWFGLHLRQGNSLIGALRSTYSQAQVLSKAWQKETPRRESLTTLRTAIDTGKPDFSVSGRIHHFLLPATGWGAAADAKDLKSIAAPRQKALKAWRSSILRKPTKAEVKRLENLSQRVEALWQFALTRLEIAEEQSRRSISVWGREADEPAKNTSREQIERDLFGNEDGAYRRLRLVMDAWSALWFWPLSELDVDECGTVSTNLPDFGEWLDALTDILGVTGKTVDHGQTALGASVEWNELNEQEQFAILSAATLPISEVVDKHPWLNTVIETSASQAFFHWDLDFSPVFAQGGFDLQVGNPPWVRPRTDLDGLYSEVDPWFTLAHKPTQRAKADRRERYAEDEQVQNIILSGIGETVATATFLGTTPTYPYLINQQPDLYRAFMERTWSNNSDAGVVSLIHPESHLTELKAAPLRRGAYLRLRRHWQFINELVLFDVHHLVGYGVHVYSAPQSTPNFLNAGSLYHPRTVAESLSHDGSGPLPGLKDDHDNWDLRPHKDRIQTIDTETLKVWHSILETGNVPILEARMVYAVNTEAAAVLEKLSHAPRIGEIDLQFSSGWHETADRKKGYFDVGWGHPELWEDAILQGPHLGVSLPMQKQPNPTMKHNQDWTEIDLEAIPADFIPATAFVRVTGDHYDSSYTHHKVDEQLVPDRSLFRFAWRKMAATTGYRTLYPALIPPAAAVSGAAITGTCARSRRSTVLAASSMSSLLADFQIRATGVANIYAQTIQKLPFAPHPLLEIELARLYTKLNSLTSAYGPIWQEISSAEWSPATPLRIEEQRRAAQNDIDAIVAISLGVTADELCMIYRTQFPVMRRYDQEDRFDANGRKVPKEILKKQAKVGDAVQLSESERRLTHPQSGVEYLYEYPFRQLDREADLRAAYAKYEKILKEN
ncbi:DNA methyltransferase [Flaviflexus huanghaiensis]|uniref:DNA methyltransferase n=1 Tax=Flaviflexus huanghaiensis TaxID=1111473 RepID=UPI0015F89986|nr:DNA methyltransferase [Flaviflexus huanghaiensis]